MNIETQIVVTVAVFLAFGALVFADLTHFLPFSLP